MLQVHLLFVSMEGGVCKAFSIILSEELAVAQANVVDLVARATSIHPLPVFWRLLSFSAPIQRKYKPIIEVHLYAYAHAFLINTFQKGSQSSKIIKPQGQSFEKSSHIDPSSFVFLFVS